MWTASSMCIIQIGPPLKPEISLEDGKSYNIYTHSELLWKSAHISTNAKMTATDNYRNLKWQNGCVRTKTLAILSLMASFIYSDQDNCVTEY